MITKEQFNTLANSVSDSYYDFVYGFYEECVEENILSQVYDYMETNPDSNTSDILEYVLKLEGITEPMVIVDDETTEYPEPALA